ncbi:hypothetical protein K488DRAFT_85796 [Vararia minispora EC-137]|uniref:Uncharacterized protein n=1 Tax=Vararia minispora EC-137 TaxID=1314806 RepID=A0ACB8QLG0_9AGAM|nr:hypothetical protein K488DRAFT_85796 [Vararia minispora EC-137]
MLSRSGSTAPITLRFLTNHSRPGMDEIHEGLRAGGKHLAARIASICGRMDAKYQAALIDGLVELLHFPSLTSIEVTSEFLKFDLWNVNRTQGQYLGTPSLRFLRLEQTLLRVKTCSLVSLHLAFSNPLTPNLYLDEALELIRSSCMTLESIELHVTLSLADHSEPLLNKAPESITIPNLRTLVIGDLPAYIIRLSNIFNIPDTTSTCFIVNYKRTPSLVYHDLVCTVLAKKAAYQAIHIRDDTNVWPTQHKPLQFDFYAQSPTSRGNWTKFRLPRNLFEAHKLLRFQLRFRRRQYHVFHLRQSQRPPLCARRYSIPL